MAAPKGLRLHIGIFGRRNVGKSSLINLITNQTLSIVSKIPGTTTDPVEKAMEIQPLGAVMLIDTAGIDDKGSLGTQRIERTKRIIDKTDMAVLVVEADIWGEFEEGLAAIFKSRNIPFMIVCGKSDLAIPSNEFIELIRDKTGVFLIMSAKTGENKELFYDKLQEITPLNWIKQNTMLGGLVNSGDIVLLVTPIDIQAPKGRMILPQVQALRDVLDSGAICIFVKENKITNMLSVLKMPPKLVVCDSQCVLQTARSVPENIMLTTFSILMARLKGDLAVLSGGANAISELKSGDKVLIAEACTHHPLKGDIGKEKIPKWLAEFTKADLTIEHCSGKDYPNDIDKYKLIIHCGACVINAQEMLSRISKAADANIPITNYGVAISFLQGALERSLEPFQNELKQ